MECQTNDLAVAARVVEEQEEEEPLEEELEEVSLLVVMHDWCVYCFDQAGSPIA